MSLSLHLFSVNDKEQHEIKWPLFDEMLRACLQTASHNMGPSAETPPHSTHAPTALPLTLAAKSLGDVATTSARAPTCTSPGSGSTVQPARQPLQEGISQPSSSAASLAPSAGLTTRVPFCSGHGFPWLSSVDLPSSTGRAGAEGTEGGKRRG